LEFLDSAHYKVEKAHRQYLVHLAMSSLWSFSFIETFPLLSSGYSKLWKRFVSVLLIAKKLKNHSVFSVGVTRNDFCR